MVTVVVDDVAVVVIGGDGGGGGVIVFCCWCSCCCSGGCVYSGRSVRCCILFLTAYCSLLFAGGVGCVSDGMDQ